MCTLTIVLLVFPGRPLDSLWAVNQDAHIAFQFLGKAAICLMFVVATACVFEAIGLWQRLLWGIRLALVILSLNIFGDLLNAVVRHDYRALIGLRVGAVMIYYLARYRTADSSSSTGAAPHQAAADFVNCASRQAIS
jgi:hypothetical protein